MTKDRLKDLYKPIPWPRVAYRRVSRQFENSELTDEHEETPIRFTTIPIDKEAHITEYLTQIDLIQRLVEKVEELTKDVRELHIKILQPMADPKFAQELDEKTDDIKKLANEISSKLKVLKNNHEAQSDQERISTQGRIKESQIFMVTRRFREVMVKYNQETLNHRERCIKAISRELQICGSRKSDEDIEEMLEKGHQESFNFPILVDTREAKQMLNEIESRHRDIAKLENSVKELHNMFSDLKMLLETQGEMINNIEYNVYRTASFVEEAKNEIKITTSYNATKRKIFVIVFIVIIVFVIIFASSFFVPKLVVGR